MADPLSFVASIVGVAGFGVQTSKALYKYVDTVLEADGRLKDLAHDIELTSSVLDTLSPLLEQERQLRQVKGTGLWKENAIRLADAAVARCRAVFNKTDAELPQPKAATDTIPISSRLKHPFTEHKIKYLQGQLDSLKSTLQLLLHLINLANEQVKG